jgi:hypothetical protein
LVRWTIGIELPKDLLQAQRAHHQAIAQMTMKLLKVFDGMGGSRQTPKVLFLAILSAAPVLFGFISNASGV